MGDQVLELIEQHTILTMLVSLLHKSPHLPISDHGLGVSEMKRIFAITLLIQLTKKHLSAPTGLI